MANSTEGTEPKAPHAGMPPWIPRLLTYVVIAAGAAYALLFAFRELRSLISMLTVALFISFALEPAVNWLAAHGWRRGLATGFVLFGLAILGIAFVASFVPLFIQQLRDLVSSLPDWLARINVYTQRWFDIDVSTQHIQDQLANANRSLGNYAADIAGNVLGIAAGIVGAVFQLLTIGLFTFYIIADGPRLRRAVCSILPPARQEEVLWAWDVAVEKTGGYLYSRLLLAAISAVASLIVLTILGVPFAVPLALWIGLISQFVPTVGTYIASVVPLLVTVLAKGGVATLILLGFILIYQQIENYLLSPRVTANTLQLHPAVAFGSVIAGAGLFGPIGAFLALPAAAIVQSGLSTYLRRHAVIASKLTEETPRPEKAERAKSVVVEGQVGWRRWFRRP